MNITISKALAAALLLTAFCGSSCTAHLFSASNAQPSQARPVVRIETNRGVEYGAATDHGILFLGRTATEGPCRVHYFLGPQVYVEDGVIQPAGGILYFADIDLKHQTAPLFARDVLPNDQLFALSMTEDDTYETGLRLAREAGIDGDIAYHPGSPLAIGTPLFVRAGEGEDERLHFVGLVAGEATLEEEEKRPRRFIVFAGADRVREMLLEPQPDPKPRRVKHRPDGITVVK